MGRPVYYIVSRLQCVPFYEGKTLLFDTYDTPSMYCYYYYISALSRWEWKKKKIMKFIVHIILDKSFIREYIFDIQIMN